MILISRLITWEVQHERDDAEAKPPVGGEGDQGAGVPQHDGVLRRDE